MSSFDLVEVMEDEDVDGGEAALRAEMKRVGSAVNTVANLSETPLPTRTLMMRQFANDATAWSMEAATNRATEAVASGELMLHAGAPSGSTPGADEAITALAASLSTTGARVVEMLQNLVSAPQGVGLAAMNLILKGNIVVQGRTAPVAPNEDGTFTVTNALSLGGAGTGTPSSEDALLGSWLRTQHERRSGIPTPVVGAPPVPAADISNWAEPRLSANAGLVTERDALQARLEKGFDADAETAISELLAEEVKTGWFSDGLDDEDNDKVAKKIARKVKDLTS